MKKNVWFLGLLAGILALGTLLASCETPTNADKWFPVTSLSQLDGTWKYAYSETQTLAEWVEDFEGISGEKLELPLEAQMFLNVKVTVKVDGTQTIDASAKTQAGSTTTTVAFSGTGSELIMYGLLGMMPEMPEGVDVQFDIPKKSMAMTIDFGPEPIDDDMVGIFTDADIQINQDGKKIKISGPDSREIIAKKQ